MPQARPRFRRRARRSGCPSGRPRAASAPGAWSRPTISLPSCRTRTSTTRCFDHSGSHIVVNRAVINELVNLHRASYLGGRLPAYNGRKSLYTQARCLSLLKSFRSLCLTMMMALAPRGNRGILRW